MYHENKFRNLPLVATIEETPHWVRQTTNNPIALISTDGCWLMSNRNYALSNEKLTFLNIYQNVNSWKIVKTEKYLSW